MWRCGEQGVKTCAAASAQVFRTKILAWSKIERPCEPLDTAHSTTKVQRQERKFSVRKILGSMTVVVARVLVGMDVGGVFVLVDVGM